MTQPSRQVDNPIVSGPARETYDMLADELDVLRETTPVPWRRVLHIFHERDTIWHAHFSAALRAQS